MESVVIVALIAGFVTVIGSLVTWWIAKRTTSGGVDTSVAADLWKEGGQIRADLREDLTTTKELVRSLRADLAVATAAVVSLENEIHIARQDTELAHAETRKLMDQIKVLTTKTAELHNEVKTSNALTIGALADNQESRRIMDIPVKDRTEQEKVHLDTAAERLPDSQRAKTPEKKKS